jgi:hypothetical protein
MARGCCLHSTGSRYDSVATSSKRDNESSGSLKGAELLRYLSDYQLLKKDSAAWSKVIK